MKSLLSFLSTLSVLTTQGVCMSDQEFDLTRGVVSFSVRDMPVILNNTGPIHNVSDEIVAMRINAFGGVNLTKKAGALDIFTKMLSHGTYNFSKEKIDEVFIRTGASVSVSASFESVSITLKCLKRFLPEILPVISEMIRVPKFDSKELSLVLRQRESDLRSELDTPDSVLGLRMHQLYYKNHPYLDRPSGYLETINQITRDDLSSLLFKTFNRNNVLFVIVGSWTEAETKAGLERYFGNLPAGNRSIEIREQPKNDSSKVYDYAMKSPTTYFMAKFKAPSLESDDYPALSIATQVLDNRLFDEVRTKRALTYSVSASLGNSLINSGSLYVSSTKLPEAVSVIFEEVKKMQIGKVTQETIDRQINKFISSWFLNRETRASQAIILSLYEILGIGWENSSSFIKRLEKVNSDQIQQVMKKYFRDMSYVAVGPDIAGASQKLQELGFIVQSTASPTETKETISN